MPITRDAEGRTLVVFGTGDIGVGYGLTGDMTDGVGCELVLCDAGGRHAVGETAADPADVYASRAAGSVRLRFERPESLVCFVQMAARLMIRMTDLLPEDE